jgi:hypothetical protein
VRPSASSGRGRAGAPPGTPARCLPRAAWPRLPAFAVPALSIRVVYGTWGLFRGYCPQLNGPIPPMEDAFAVSRDAENPPVRFDVARAGDGVIGISKRARSWKQRTQPRGVLHTTALVPDPTGLKLARHSAANLR